MAKVFSRRNQNTQRRGLNAHSQKYPYCNYTIISSQFHDKLKKGAKRKIIHSTRMGVEPTIRRVYIQTPRDAHAPRRSLYIIFIINEFLYLNTSVQRQSRLISFYIVILSVKNSFDKEVLYHFPFRTPPLSSIDFSYNGYG